MIEQQRLAGGLVGLAVGDAVGCTTEFKARGRFRPVTDMVGGGKFRLQPGEWTDDTSMALCSAQSLIECQGFDAKDHMDKFVRWFEEGYFSCKPRGFGIGKTIIRALGSYVATGKVYAGLEAPNTAGNGSLMRIAPIAMYYRHDLTELLDITRLASKITHAAPEAIDACLAFVQILRNAYQGLPKNELLNGLREIEAAKILEVIQGGFNHKTAEEIKGSGYVVESLEAALWCFYQTDNFKDAILLATNLGDDADTTAAICGQLAGAFYGLDAIPLEWRKKLQLYSIMLEMASKLGASS